jgi:MoxR-like ATPase
MVLATQNPIDHEGTYNLPEAQSDRFMFKVLMPSPDAPTLGRIIGKRAGARPKDTQAVGPGLDPEDLPEIPLDVDEQIRERIRNAVPIQAVESHIVNLCLATNGQSAGLDQPAGSQAEIQKCARAFRFGFSARAAGDLMLAAKAVACLFPTPLDAVSAPHLGEVVVPVLRHRLKLHPEFEPDTDGASPDSSAQRAIETKLSQLCRLVAPKRSGYELYWEQQWKP